MDNKKSSVNEKQWDEMKQTVDLCLRLLSNPSPAAETTLSPQATPTESKRGHVLLSYNENMKALVQKLKEKLWAAGEENIGPGSLNETIADAL